MTAKEFKAKYAWGSLMFCGVRLDTRTCSNCNYGAYFLSATHTHQTLKGADCVSTEILLRCMACSSRFRTHEYYGCAHWDGGNDSPRVQKETQLCLDY